MGRVRRPWTLRVPSLVYASVDGGALFVRMRLGKRAGLVNDGLRRALVCWGFGGNAERRWVLVMLDGLGVT